ncbi:four-carbon acid sugar kinase family protein [Pullulanibacillus sp. KACC 23026]|uniref:four-carbon acid sugar kinase family protein n=1 Tax=Pullulanibacillus sp. KACC 23026 TaxID=3028315 RepID=UPI0023B004C3|nr:four-carbon acid sugar kinase family protein [Pullulanibacillus sp. KACC 23026]WEG13470.1 four-carbon acid sugar kinase family protein [Pullulanibacillus sp. KACC 23026]
MQRFYIIADDLTGANDAGVQLSKIGISSTVFLDFNETSIQATEDVAIIDTDSRAINEKAAYNKIYEACTVFKNQGYEHVYKKMDSTLRGNVAAELSAVVSVHSPELVVVAPAFPKMNRQTINGHQYVHGELVSETEFGKDPKTPVIESSIPNLLKQGTDDPICLIDRELLNGDKDHLRALVLEKVNQGRVWFVCDAKTDADLKAIVSVFGSLNKRTVWAGSAGLIEFLPEALHLKKTTMCEQSGLALSKTLTVSASLSNVTKRQLETVRTMSNTYFIELDPVELVKSTYSLKAIIDELLEHSDKQNFVLFVDSSANNREATKRLEQELVLCKTQISEAISEELGKIAKVAVIAMPEIKGLILTGGDTAKAICNHLNMTKLKLYTEIEIGLPLGELSSETVSRTFWTVTKSGGFGNEESLKNVLIYMSQKG